MRRPRGYTARRAIINHLPLSRRHGSGGGRSRAAARGRSACTGCLALPCLAGRPGIPGQLHGHPAATMCGVNGAAVRSSGSQAAAWRCRRSGVKQRVVVLAVEEHGNGRRGGACGGAGVEAVILCELPQPAPARRRRGIHPHRRPQHTGCH
jgi:hypothetical protein